MNSPVDRSLSEANPFDAGLLAHRYDWYEQMRSQGDVVQNPVTGFWFAVSRRAVLEAVRQPTLFSNRVQDVLHRTGGIPEEVSDEIAAIKAQGWTEMAVLETEDPPEHDRQRALINKAFTPHRVRELHPRLNCLVEDMVGELTSARTFEFVSAFAAPLPLRVIAELLNVDPENIATFKLWSDARAAAIGNDLPAEAHVQNARYELERQRYFAAELERRRQQPTDDLLTDLTTARLDRGDGITGMPMLSDAESLSMLGQLLLAGNETTTKLLTWSVKALTDNPGLWRTLRSDPDKYAPLLVEEVLRYYSPVQGNPRRVTEDAELCGVRIPAGSVLFLMWASAGRDGSHYKNPREFDLDRANPMDHLAFGKGTHFCLGANLARAEARLSLVRMARAWSEVEQSAATDVEAGFVFHGLKELHLRVVPA